MKRASLLLIGLLALSACGRMGELQRRPGMAALPVAAGANRPETPTELLKPSTQARPQRNVDILYRSENRPEDQFDIRPGEQNGR